MRLAKFELTPEQVEAFGAELQELEERTRAKLGEEDAKYIRRVMKLERNLDAAGRLLLLGSLLPPAWLAGTTLLGMAKILDNMEIGHNVMHGQYDFMNDPVINTNYEWDTMCPGDQWRHSHNYVHHTYTNVLGLDHDIGYRIARLSEEQPWHPKWLMNIPNTALLATFFEWGVGVHDSNLADAALDATPTRADLMKLVELGKKVVRQVGKDYVLFPLLAGPMAGPVLLGNATANFIRNYWTWAVIFCGHFPEGTLAFTEEQIANETRGQWYLRQMAGSANIEGSKLMHLMTGHLSHQIEHHLFPTIPAWRYPEMGKEVRAIAEKYGVPYNTGSFARQLGSMFKQVARLSLPLSVDDALSWRTNAKRTDAQKAAGMQVLEGKRRPGEAASAPAARKTGLPGAVRQVRKALRKSSGWLSSAAA